MKPNTNKEGNWGGGGEERGEDGPPSCLSVRLLAVIAVLVSTDGQRPLPSSASDLAFVLTGWIKYGITSTNCTLRIYIFFVFAFHRVSVYDVWTCLIAFYLLCGGWGWVGRSATGLATCCLFSYLLVSSVALWVVDGFF